MRNFLACLLISTAYLVGALKFDSREVDYNLNQNQQAQNVLEYSGEWPNHQFHESPSNWRFPFYTLFLDRFVNGDPQNDNANGTLFEHDPLSNQFRHGGDLAGLTDTLDYIQGMGIKGLYLAGTPFLNLPWKSDGYSPIDFSLLDKHFGTIIEWRAAIDEIHRRGMYVVLDNTMSTMADLIGFDGFLNSTTPFSPTEHKALYKSNIHYPDFNFGNNYNSTCEYPRFWNESGYRVLKDSDPNFAQLNGCFDSEFDQYGDTEAFGVFPDWQRQLSKFASVQDRLREWVPSVREKIQTFSCLTIAMLDIDGFRFDKATQVTVDAQAEFGDSIRQCARRFNKQNFFMPGEITGGNTFGSIYLGRGRQPDQVPENLTVAVTMTNASSDKYFLRDSGKNALDAAAFHYSIYRSLTRFLGMDGNLTAGYDVPVNFVDTWNTMLTTNDLVNANTGEFDPRHMYGTTNQDVFRWPAIKDGTSKMLLGLFITTLHMPGIPLLMWGEEQSFYVLDNTADNYIFGRQPLSSALGWQNHGCYRLGSSQYFDFPVDAAKNGCNDDNVSLDHRDPSHPIRNIIKSMYYLRRNFPVLNDGYFLQSLSNQTHQVFLPGSNGTATEVGMWSVMRDQWLKVQNLKGNAGNQSVWFLYQNEDHVVKYSFDCTSNDTALISPFDAGTTVKNLLAPYDEITLQKGPKKLGIDFSEKFNGCTDEITLGPWEFKVYVPKDVWVPPQPMVTKFSPGHDARIKSTVGSDGEESIAIELQFSQAMDCGQITKNLDVKSITGSGQAAQLDLASVSCSNISNPDASSYAGGVSSHWSFKANLVNVTHGIHAVSVTNASSSDGTGFTDSNDHFWFRIGQVDNPIVFPRVANYSQNVLFKDAASGNLYVSHKASGADKWRYSTNWGSSWSDWADYKGTNDTLTKQSWSGTKAQEWSGEHVILQYWSKYAGSSAHLQHADLNWGNQAPRRFPHLFAEGPFNLFGFDGGAKNAFEQDSDGVWKFNLMTEWPSNVQVNVWGINPDGQPDHTIVLGNMSNNGILDRAVPDALAPTPLNITDFPPSPYLSYRVEIRDSDYSWQIVPSGSRFQQILLFALLWAIPVATGIISVWAYMGAFYNVKFNKIGIMQKKNFLPFVTFRGKFQKLRDDDEEEDKRGRSTRLSPLRPLSLRPSSPAPAIVFSNEKRRTVLIATMEYDIEDWNIKIKIGGLGVMAQLMGKALTHQDLIWVVPCVGGIDYPTDTPADPMVVTVFGNPYEVQVQYHQLKNITYVLLDAPIFRQQTKSEPYPPRMDDLDSAVYYSAWNACIAETIKRFPVDIYHINDYHGAAAPLYLLPKTIPCALSLHNAEFQGLWPMRTPKEREEVCKVFNLDQSVVKSYVQFGEVFNLLHAAASYLRVHQKGYGAVGVSNKYGERSYARYPIFWGLKKIGKLPNPDPSDIAPVNTEEENNQVIKVDPAFEASRGDLRKKAQEWAGLNVDPEAELFVFVGRWSNQKGVDLIADVFPAVLEKHPKVQLICVGPVIDLYGKFAALKLGKLMEKYPGRVYSKPEFTALPPYIFSGAEFALIPSRDEPFGLVAVEFGRKGALGVGARVGGLGQMPGWWFTVESTTTKHLQNQFKSAIEDALASKTSVRALMRARSAKQRFPVAKWVESLNEIQSTAIKVHQEEQGSTRLQRLRLPSTSSLRDSGFFQSRSRNVSMDRLSTYEAEATEDDVPAVPDLPSGLNRSLSLGVRNGPGHRARHNRSASEESNMSHIGEDEHGETDNQRDLSAEQIISMEDAEASMIEAERSRAMQQLSERSISPYGLPEPHDVLIRGRTRAYRSRSSLTVDPFEERRGRSSSPYAGENLLSTGQTTPRPRNSSRVSVLSLYEVKGDKTDYSLQKVDPTFNDTNGEFYRAFENMLSKLDAKNSETDLCIEEYLVESEKAWFKRLREAKLGHTRSRASSPDSEYHDHDSSGRSTIEDEFLLGENYQSPSFVKRLMQRRIGDWPVYSLLLALGQIIAANSYQITLLTGGQDTPTKLYIVGAIYIVTSCIWWVMFRTLKSIYTLSLPFLFYGLAFLLVGLSPFVSAGTGRQWMANVATGMYVTASSSGSLFFALNFGDEGGAPIKAWVYRACVIQGTQQIYIAALFYWGNTLVSPSTTNALTSSKATAAITIPIAALLWAIGIILFTALPPYYTQSPGAIPSFYQTLLRRKTIAWFFVAVILQNYFLSAPYGRNWAYLWSSNYAPQWAIAILIVIFFIVIWALLLLIFGRLSRDHSWILPIFAIGLGAPRWAQMLWGVSGFGSWLPWMPGGPIAGALAGRSLWLWLGLLDSIQGVGFGMMLLQTLTRIHIAVTLILVQILGTVITMLAKGTAPDKDGPGDVFPDFSAGIIQAINKPWFWVALAAQLLIPLGFFKVFRKEQLSKP